LVVGAELQGDGPALAVADGHEQALAVDELEPPVPPQDEAGHPEERLLVVLLLQPAEGLPELEPPEAAVAEAIDLVIGQPPEAQALPVGIGEAQAAQQPAMDLGPEVGLRRLGPRVAAAGVAGRGCGASWRIRRIDRMGSPGYGGEVLTDLDELIILV